MKWGFKFGLKDGVRLSWRAVAVLAVAAPIAAVGVGALGILNVGARGGHWAVTDWFLHFVMRASVESHATTVTPPDVLPDAVIPAAGHYARGCAPCHGAPDAAPLPAMRAMLPPPPDLVDKVGEWSDAELFQIVKNGVRFTGMPAWPTERDDEVWAMVAFLRQIPTLDGPAYRQLAFGAANAATEPRPGSPADCQRCHGADGASGGPHVPILAGQSAAYLTESIRAYASGARASGLMSGPAQAVAPAEIADLAAAFAALPRPRGTLEDPARPRGAQGDPALIDAGRRLAERGRAEDDIPACLGCHRDGANPLYPRLDGQNAPVLATQLRLFRAGTRGGGPAAPLMTRAAGNLSDADIAALAAFFAAR